MIANTTSHHAVLDDAEACLRTDPSRSLELASTVRADHSASTRDLVRSNLIASRANIHLGRYDEGEVFARAALETSAAEHFKKELGNAHIELGIYRFVQSEFDSALAEYENAERILKSIGSFGDLARVYVNVGNVYQRKGECHNAASLYEQAITLAEENGDILTQAKVLMNLSALFQYVVFDPETGAEYADRAIELYKRTGDVIGLAKCLVNKGNFHLRQENHNLAAECYRQALEVRSNATEPDEHAMNYGGLIVCMLNDNNIQEAERLLFEAREKLSGNTNGFAAPYYLLSSEARILNLKGEHEKAIEAAEKVRAFLKENQMAEQLFTMTNMLADSLYHAGRYKESAERYRELSEMQHDITLERVENRLLYLKGKLDISHVRSEAELERIKNVELAQAVKNLETLHRENDEYVALLAHELRSPLHNIREISSILANNATMPPDERIGLQREMLGIVTRMLDLIAHVLDRTKHRYASDEGVVNARTIWEHVLNVAAIAAQTKHVNVKWEIGLSTIPVKASERDLITVIDNLLSNSIKYSNPGSRVSVSIDGSGTTVSPLGVLLSVRDDGPGFTREDLKRLFRPFETLTARPTANEPSTGIGLHLLKRAVDRLGGRVWCESTEGAGSTFYVELPLS